MIIVITNPENIENEHVMIHELFDAGLDCLHVRKPMMLGKDYQTFINKVDEKHHSKLVLHQHHHMENIYSIKGIHGKVESAISCSMHAIGEIKEEGDFYEYVFLSPVFDSISKQGYISDLNPTEVETYLTLTSQRPKIIALGGIDEKEISLVQNMGFDGIALLGAVWETYLMVGEKEALTKFKKIKTLWGNTVGHTA